MVLWVDPFLVHASRSMYRSEIVPLPCISLSMFSSIYLVLLGRLFGYIFIGHRRCTTNKATSTQRLLLRPTQPSSLSQVPIVEVGLHLLA